jgi:drug/metabolite transporter (DMT)-like permease
MTAGAAMISFSSVWVKLAHVSPTMAGFYRVFFGAVFLSVATGWRREFKWIGWIMITNALPRVRTSRIGLILLLQPSLSFIWDVVFFQRPTSPVNWLGVSMVLAAIYLGMARKPA